MCFPLLFVLHVPHDVPHIYIAKTSMGVNLMFHKGPSPEARGHVFVVLGGSGWGSKKGQKWLKPAHSTSNDLGTTF